MWSQIVNINKGLHVREQSNINSNSTVVFISFLFSLGLLYAGLKHFYKLTEGFRYSIHCLVDNRFD